jgi:hypothetical protein
MEFVPLRSLQRGRPEVWETLEQGPGRIILTNRGRPAYMLVDLKDHDIISFVSKFDSFNSEQKG